MPYTIEDIPNANSVNRWVFYPFNFHQERLHIKSCFQFEDRTGAPKSVSINWDKYLSAPEEIHTRGKRKAEIDNEAVPNRQSRAYKGYLEANVGKIRAINANNQICFTITHDPVESTNPDLDNRAHTHLNMEVTGNPEKGIRNHAKVDLGDCFGSLKEP